MARQLVIESLELLGHRLDEPLPSRARKVVELGRRKLWIPTYRDNAIEEYLRIRTKTRRRRFELNRAQREYSRRCSKRNIVLKARQLGITTYIAARFFVQTIARPGTLSVQVAHDRESAEEIFRIVRRFWENLPAELHREYSLRTSHCNARQLVFPLLDSEYTVATADENAGRGWTLSLIHI